MAGGRFTCETEGERLDVFLARRLPELSRSYLKDVIMKGCVTVEGRPARPDRRLREGDVVELVHPEAAAGPSLKSRVLHEDEDILILDKPAGLVMHPLGESWLRSAQALLSEESLAAALLRERPGIARGGVPRCGIVHRLDRQTSGVLAVAKTVAAYRALTRAFRDKRVSKTYRAIVAGNPEQKLICVEAPVGRAPGRRRVGVTPLGRSSQTEFKVLKACGQAALVEARPLTGRTHQIRAHLAHLGHQVLGDPDFPSAPWPPPPRLMLHAWRLEFAHPGSGRKAAFEAPLPKDFRDYWAALLSTR